MFSKVRQLCKRFINVVLLLNFPSTDRVREKERANAKFSFLSPDDAYAPFYLWRLSEIKEGRGTAVSAGRPEQAAVKQPEKPKGPEKPPDFHFSAPMPNINALDLEVLKLTALFVAKRGKSFMTTLSQRETRNSQFDFLRPQHSLYQYFTHLVDQYTELLAVNDAKGKAAEEERLAQLKLNVENKHHILGRAKQRGEYTKFQEKEKQKKEEEHEQEKISYAQIDWHDFVVVETVVFTEDHQRDLPPPTSLNDLQTASLEQKAAISLAPANRRIEEAMPTDDESKNFYNAHPAQPTTAPQPSTVPPTVTLPQHPVPASLPQRPIGVSSPGPFVQPGTYPAVPPAVPAAAPTTTPVMPSPIPQTPMHPPSMRVRTNYVPLAQARRYHPNVSTIICPNCRQSVPSNEYDQHLRQELHDPRWKEQRAKEEARYATTNLALNEAPKNLKRLASQRTDVFDPALGHPAPQETEEEARRKRVAMGWPQ